MRLIELSSPNHPLLRKILTEAPGTYHHSIMVANLSESACEAIGANGLLARVGCYYHDIGKTKRPQFFIENQMNIENPHDRLPPQTSKNIIIAHATDGAEMLRKHKMLAVTDEEADSGTDLAVLGDLSVGGTTAASTLVAALCGTDASVVTGRGGAGIDDLAWMNKCAAIRDALRRARPVLGDQLELLATAGGADLAAITGFLLQCAVRRTPVILDGVVSAACALVGQRIAFRAPDWWLAGQASGEPAQEKALDRMAVDPLLDHGVTAGEGTGALLALPMVQAAAALLAELPERGTHGDDPAGPDGSGAADGNHEPAHAGTEADAQPAD